MHTSIKKITQPFALSEDLIAELNARVPSGQRSAFVERILMREFGLKRRIVVTLEGEQKCGVIPTAEGSPA